MRFVILIRGSDVSEVFTLMSDQILIAPTQCHLHGCEASLEHGVRRKFRMRICNKSHGALG